MTVIRTDEWLMEHYEQPLKICKKLKSLFPNASEDEIHHHLIQFGMYEKADRGKEGIEQWKQMNAWKIVQNEEKKLKKLWNGPDIPIFIFPSAANNRRLLREYNGKSGLTFKDKLFLFISEHNSKQEIRALFTHEYNHAARISKINKAEKDFVLLDHIIMEGLAEHAVKERVGQDYLANWTRFYTDVQLERIWKGLIFPNRKLYADHPKHPNILYGLKWYPKMAGYCIGYYLVKEYVKKHYVSTKEMLSLPSEEIAGIVKKDSI